MQQQEYPLNTQLGAFNSDQDIDLFLSTINHSAVLYYDYTLIGQFSYIYTPQVVEYLQRYKLLKNHGITSFGNDFDTIPAIWVDVISLIDSEIEKAMNEKNRHLNG